MHEKKAGTLNSGSGKKGDKQETSICHGLVESQKKWRKSSKEKSECRQLVPGYAKKLRRSFS
ncbi:hypothetical protein BH09BAC3_BH09BAC3_17180 [soil metagenome]